MQTAVDQIPIRRANIRGLEADLARIKVSHLFLEFDNLFVVNISPFFYLFCYIDSMMNEWDRNVNAINLLSLY